MIIANRRRIPTSIAALCNRVQSRNYFDLNCIANRLVSRTSGPLRTPLPYSAGMTLTSTVHGCQVGLRDSMSFLNGVPRSEAKSFSLARNTTFVLWGWLEGQLHLVRALGFALAAGDHDFELTTGGHRELDLDCALRHCK